MPLDLPADWKSLNVSRDLRIRGNYDQNLRVQRLGHTPVIYAVWLPDASEDPRPHQGRSKGTGKRLPMKASTGHTDPIEAGKWTIQWWKEQKQRQVQLLNDQEEREQHSLHKYWNTWFTKQSALQKSKRNFDRWKRDTQSKWHGESYGIKHQPWAQKSVDQIHSGDLANYFTEVLDARRTDTNDMSETKRQQKTLMRALLNEARLENPTLGEPKFPEIPRAIKEVVALNQNQWDCLLQSVIELSDGSCRFSTEADSYRTLPFSEYRRSNQRNWVDLWDALHIQWFFYTRAEDMPRFRCEWFRQEQEDIVLHLEVTKGDRKTHDTYAYRADANALIRDVLTRKGNVGYAVLPHLSRRKRQEAESMVMQTLNFLLKRAAEFANEKFNTAIDIKALSWTTIRHTAFRLTLEDNPDLDAPKKLRDFAANGHTSEKMLLERYLNPIRREQQARGSREKIKPGKHTGHFFDLIMEQPDSEEQRKKILALSDADKHAAVKEANRRWEIYNGKQLAKRNGREDVVRMALERSNYAPDLMLHLLLKTSSKYTDEQVDNFKNNPERLKKMWMWILKHHDNRRRGIDANGEVFIYFEGQPLPKRITYPVTI